MTDTAGSSIELPPPPAAQPPSNGFSRLIGVLFNPVETLASIARQPDILVPLVLVIVVSFLSGFVNVKKIDFVANAREQMESQGKLSQEQIDQQMRIAGSIAKGVAYVSPVMGIAFMAAMAAIMMLGYRLMGGEGGYKQYFSVSLYAWMPQLIKTIVTSAVLMARSQPLRAEFLEAVVHSNPAFLVDFKTHPVLFSLLTSFDVFSIWWAVLMIIGLAFVAKMSRGKSAAIFISIWAFFTCLKVGATALGAMMRSK